MKKKALCFFALSVLLNINSFGQIRVLKTEIEQKDGVVYHNGAEFSGTVVDMFGELLVSETSYKNGKLDGVKKRYHYDNKLKSEAHYKDGKQVGVFQGYYPSGQMMMEINFKDGVEHGEQKMWGKNGQLSSKRNFVEGKQHGLEKGWHEGGQLKYEVNFVDGEVDGIQKEWYESGELFSTVGFSKGKITGLAKRWYENGQLSGEANFQNGKQEGSEKIWYENGQIMLEAQFKNDEFVGVSKEWHENGQIMFEKEYQDGKEVSVKEWDEEGKEINNIVSIGKYEVEMFGVAYIWVEHNKVKREGNEEISISISYESEEGNGIVDAKLLVKSSAQFQKLIDALVGCRKEIGTSYFDCGKSEVKFEEDFGTILYNPVEKRVEIYDLNSKLTWFNTPSLDETINLLKGIEFGE